MSLVQNVFVDFGSFQLDIPHLSLSDEGITALVGESGSGKTTFLKVLLGVQKCASFSWIFKGEDLAKLSLQKRRIGVVFQENDIFPHLTGEQNMLFAGSPRHKSKQDLKKLLDKVAHVLEINHILKQKARDLSGGEQQRLAIANALMSQSRILLLDEPFSALDSKRHQAAQSLIRNLVEEFNIPALMVTHDVRDINEVAHFVIHLSDGKVV